MNLKPSALLTGLLLCWGAVLAAGLTSQVSLGDEIHHYDFAKDAFNQQERPVVHSLFPAGYENSIRYTTDPGWPLTLASIWKLTRGISFPAAQIFHSLFYFLLGASVYAISFRLYGKPAAVWAALLTLSVPMIASFGILFYTDLPAVALVCVSFLSFMNRRYFSAGMLIALAFLFKKTAALFFPAALILIIAVERTDWKKIPVFILLYFAAPCAAVLNEKAWLSRHFDSIAAQDVSRRLYLIYQAGQESLQARIADMFFSTEFSNSSLYRPADLLKYFGAALIAGLGLYFWKKCFEKKDRALWLFAAVYIPGAFFLRLIPDLRYLMPVVPLLCIFAGKAFSRISTKVPAAAVILLCVVQLAAVSFYTNSQRRISPPVSEGFAWIRGNTPQDSIIMYPELNILEYAQRPMVWGLFKIRKVFWGTPEERRNELRDAGVNYIAVLKSRTYNDANIRHIGGYPASFLAQLPALNYVSRVYENEKISVWKVDGELLKG